MRQMLTVLSIILWTGSVVAQQVTVEVWNYVNQSAPPIPSSTASVKIRRAANLPLVPLVPVPPPPPMGTSANEYIVNGNGLGPLADINVDDRGCHPWTVRDLGVAGSGNQRIVVHLFRLNYPIKAPQCFALKTEYERLFRDEQQKVLEQQLRQPNPNMDPDRLLALAQRRARLLYADGLLALPNPERREKQPLWVNEMLTEMEQQQDLQPSQYDIDELSKMVDGLFGQYNMTGFETFTPSIWSTTYQSPNGPVESEVKLWGTYGTYTVGDRVNTLDQIDIAFQQNNDGDGAFYVTGRWRFAENEGQGRFRWRMSDSTEDFEGTWHFDQDNTPYRWSGKRLQIPHDGAPYPPPPGTLELPAPPVN